MLRIRYETEEWRELLLQAIDEAESSYGIGERTDASNYDDLADNLCRLVLDCLVDSDIEYERAYNQSKGSFVILQGNPTEQELNAFDKAVDECLEEIIGEVWERAKELDQLQQENA